MKSEELRTKTVDEVNDQINDLSKEAFNLRLQQGSAQRENTAPVRAVRRELARSDTLLNEKARETSSAGV